MELDADSYYQHSIDLLNKNDKLIIDEIIKIPLGKMQNSVLKSGLFVFMPLTVIIGYIFSFEVFSGNSYLLRTILIILLIVYWMYYTISFIEKQKVTIFRTAWMKFLQDKNLVDTNEIDDDKNMKLIEKYINDTTSFSDSSIPKY